MFLTSFLSIILCWYSSSVVKCLKNDLYRNISFTNVCVRLDFGCERLHSIYITAFYIQGVNFKMLDWLYVGRLNFVFEHQKTFHRNQQKPLTGIYLIGFFIHITKLQQPIFQGTKFTKVQYSSLVQFPFGHGNVNERFFKRNLVDSSCRTCFSVSTDEYNCLIICLFNRRASEYLIREISRRDLLPIALIFQIRIDKSFLVF